MFEVHLESSNLADLSTQLGRRKSHIEKAMNRAAVSFNSLLKSDVLSAVRKEIGLSREDMNKIRIRSKVKRSRLEVSMWVGSNPVDVRYLLPRWTKKGVAVGRGDSRQVFERAFMPWKSRGRAVILQRLGKERLPVTKPDVDINPIVIATIERRWSDLENYFYRRVNAELEQIK